MSLQIALPCFVPDEGCFSEEGPRVASTPIHFGYDMETKVEGQPCQQLVSVGGWELRVGSCCRLLRVNQHLPGARSTIRKQS